MERGRGQAPNRMGKRLPMAVSSPVPGLYVTGYTRSYYATSSPVMVPVEEEN